MKKLLKMLSDLHPETEFSGNERLIDDSIIDSLDIVTLVTDINSEYGVAIGGADITKENFASPSDIARLIIRNGGNLI